MGTMPTLPSPKIILGISLIFATGAMAGYGFSLFLDRDKESEANQNSKQIRQVGEYQYTNPLLECEVAVDTITARKENFDAALEDFVTETKKKHQLLDVAVYFRDLNNGPTFGVAESDEFFPASLLKVPVMMAYYRWLESEPELFDVQLEYVGPVDFGLSIAIQPNKELIPGQKYTIRDLIERMIVYSDNQSTYLLVQQLPQEKISNLFRIIGVGEDVIKDGSAKLTVKEYAGFFRILFNSSYLSQENSEKALELLTRTDYHDALPGPLPKEVAVAHKFGEAGTENAERQLHDCGIVYFPGHPYLACIMTRGENNDHLKNGIRAISRFIYDQVDKQY